MPVQGRTLPLPYSTAIPLLPLWAVRPVQSLSACTRVHFTFLLSSESLHARYKGAGVGTTLTEHKAVRLHLKLLLPTVPIFSTAQDHWQTTFRNQRHHLGIPNLDQYCGPLKPLLHSLLL